MEKQRYYYLITNRKVNNGEQFFLLSDEKTFNWSQWKVGFKLFKTKESANNYLMSRDDLSGCKVVEVDTHEMCLSSYPCDECDWAGYCPKRRENEKVL